MIVVASTTTAQDLATMIGILKSKEKTTGEV